MSRRIPGIHRDTFPRPDEAERTRLGLVPCSTHAVLWTLLSVNTWHSRYIAVRRGLSHLTTHFSGPIHAIDTIQLT